jgi:hypothetical protein
MVDLSCNPDYSNPGCRLHKPKRVLKNMVESGLNPEGGLNVEGGLTMEGLNIEGN